MSFDLSRLHRFSSKEEWLEARTGQSLGASDMGKVLGLYPALWEDCTREHLLLEKTGQVPRADLSRKPAVEWGHWQEPVVAQVFFEEVFPSLVDDYEDWGLIHGGYCRLTHPRLPFLSCTPDYFLQHWKTNEFRGLECKSTSNPYAWERAHFGTRPAKRGSGKVSNGKFPKDDCDFTMEVAHAPPYHVAQVATSLACASPCSWSGSGKADEAIDTWYIAALASTAHPLLWKRYDREGLTDFITHLESEALRFATDAGWRT